MQSEVKGTLSPIPKEKGRILLYGTVLLGAAVQPTVEINDVVVGQAKPREFFHSDSLAEHYDMNAMTE